MRQHHCVDQGLEDTTADSSTTLAPRRKAGCFFSPETRSSLRGTLLGVDPVTGLVCAVAEPRTTIAALDGLGK